VSWANFEDLNAIVNFSKFKRRECFSKIWFFSVGIYGPRKLKPFDSVSILALLEVSYTNVVAASKVSFVAFHSLEVKLKGFLNLNFIWWNNFMWVAFALSSRMRLDTFE